MGDSGLSDNRAHIGMYTELGILYAKYKPEKLMDFIKLNVSGSKLNIPKLIRACERHYHWKEAVFLYIHYDEYGHAAEVESLHSRSGRCCAGRAPAQQHAIPTFCVL